MEVRQYSPYIQGKAAQIWKGASTLDDTVTDGYSPGLLIGMVAELRAQLDAFVEEVSK